MTRELTAYWLGRRNYGPVLALQERLHAERREGRGRDLLLLLEHEPVITLGRGTRAGHILAPEETFSQLGVERFESARGGDVTLHAPGQLVGYPILDLSPDRRDVRRYVGDLTRLMQGLVGELGIGSGTFEPHVGLWVDRASVAAWPGAETAREAVKIGAIGVKISRWVTMHGFALNLRTNLELFQLIVPCGIRTHGVTSAEQLLGQAPTPEQIAPRAQAILSGLLGAKVGQFVDASARELEEIES